MVRTKMTTVENLLSSAEKQALQKIKTAIQGLFEIERIVLFGSAARGEADEESDVDLLLVTKRRLNRRERHRITDAVCEVNLEYGTNFSTLVVDSYTWQHGFMTYLNIHKEIQREGVSV